MLPAACDVGIKVCRPTAEGDLHAVCTRMPRIDDCTGKPNQAQTNSQANSKARAHKSGHMHIPRRRLPETAARAGRCIPARGCVGMKEDTSCARPAALVVAIVRVLSSHKARRFSPLLE